MSYIRPSSAAADSTWEGAPTYARPAAAAADVTWEPQGPIIPDVTLFLSGSGVLGQPTIQGGIYSPLAAQMVRGVTRYLARLTGAENGLDDVVLPISAFQVRHREATDSYYSITIPSYAFIDALAARPLGKVVIWSDTGGVTEELMRGSLGDVRSDRGASSQSITISGNASQAATTPQTYLIEKASYAYTTFAGGSRLRIEPRAGIRPGDTIGYQGAYFTAGEISWSVSVSDTGLSAQMEVSEAAS